MSNLTSRPIDPRDTGWEVWNPAYRVYFWRRVSATGWGSRELEVSGDDIVAALDWATRNANDGETYTCTQSSTTAMNADSSAWPGTIPPATDAHNCHRSGRP
jgi:hypothetical protein